MTLWANMRLHPGLYLVIIPLSKLGRQIIWGHCVSYFFRCRRSKQYSRRREFWDRIWWSAQWRKYRTQNREERKRLRISEIWLKVLAFLSKKSIHTFCGCCLYQSTTEVYIHRQANWKYRALILRMCRKKFLDAGCLSKRSLRKSTPRAPTCGPLESLCGRFTVWHSFPMKISSLSTPRSWQKESDYLGLLLRPKKCNAKPSQGKECNFADAENFIFSYGIMTSCWTQEPACRPSLTFTGNVVGAVELSHSDSGA